MLSHARLPPPPTCVFRYSSRARWQWVLRFTAMRPLCSSAPPVVARMVSFPDQLAYRRQTPSAPENARRSGNATRRVVPTNKGRRTTIAGAFLPAGQILAEIHQPSAPRGPRTLAMVQGATPDAVLEQTPSKRQMGLFRNRRLSRMKSGQFFIRGLSMWRDRPSY
jgi:hypothetical protein